MFLDHDSHEGVGHYGFTADAVFADELYDPPVPSTLVNLYGPYDTVTVAAMILDNTHGLDIVDVETPHPCSLLHGCVHAVLIFDGHIESATVRDAISAVFGQPIPAPTAPSPASTAHLN